MVYVSGHAPYSNAGHQYRGRLGDTLDLSDGRSAARLAVLGCLVSLELALGTLDAVDRIVKLNGYVHCVPGYEPLPKVTDAASELLIDLFEEADRHSRTTVGVASLPNGVAVELEMIVLAQPGCRGQPSAPDLPSTADA